MIETWRVAFDEVAVLCLEGLEALMVLKTVDCWNMNIA